MLIRQPNLVLAMSLFVYEILDDQFSSKDHFPLIQYWGHTFTIDLILQRRTDLAGIHVSRALQNAAKFGNTHIIDRLLQRCTGSPAFMISLPLQNAIKNDRIHAVDFLIQPGNNIGSCIVGWALVAAAEIGHTHIIDH